MDKLKNLNKALLLPILAAIATLVKELYGYEIPGQYIDLTATFIVWAVSFIGLFLHPKKKGADFDEYLSNTIQRTE